MSASNNRKMRIEVSFEVIPDTESEPESKHEEDDEEEEKEERVVNGTEMSFFLSDPIILDCAICRRPLTPPPVYQCKVGHIVCSNCSSVYKKRCWKGHGISSSTNPMPAIYRCKAIDMILKSV